MHFKAQNNFTKPLKLYQKSQQLEKWPLPVAWNWTLETNMLPQRLLAEFNLLVCHSKTEPGVFQQNFKPWKVPDSTKSKHRLHCLVSYLRLFDFRVSFQRIQSGLGWSSVHQVCTWEVFVCVLGTPCLPCSSSYRLIWQKDPATF